MAIRQRQDIVPDHADAAVHIQNIATFAQGPFTEAGAWKASITCSEDAFSLELWHR